MPDPNNPQPVNNQQSTDTPVVPTVDPVVPPTVSPTVPVQDSPFQIPDSSDVAPIPDFMNQGGSDSPVPPVNGPAVQPPIVDSGSAAPSDFPSMASVTTPKKKFGGGKIIATILGILVLVGGVGTGVYLTQQQQLLNSNAWVSNKDKQTAANNRAQINNAIKKATYSEGGGTSGSQGQGQGGATVKQPGNATNFDGNKGTYERLTGKDPTKPENQTDFNNYLKKIQAGEVVPNTNPNFKCNDSTQLTCGDGGGFCLDRSAGKTCIQEARDRGYTIVIGKLECVKSVDPDGKTRNVPADLDTSHYSGSGFADAVKACDGMPLTGFGSGMYQCQIGINGYTGGTCTDANSINKSTITSIPGCFCGVIQIDTGNGHTSLEGNCGCGGSETTTTTTSDSALCQNVKAYSSTWTLLTSAQLSALTPGTTVNFCVVGSATAGVFDKAQFTINTVVQPETTVKRPTTQDYCQSYIIPTGVTSFNVTAKIHHATLGWK